ncbi:MAG: hypothetical protein NVSMB22_07480 [Chloroflexota bacterium]
MPDVRACRTTSVRTDLMTVLSLVRLLEPTTPDRLSQCPLRQAQGQIRAGEILFSYLMIVRAWPAFLGKRRTLYLGTYAGFNLSI